MNEQTKTGRPQTVAFRPKREYIKTGDQPGDWVVNDIKVENRMGAESFVLDRRYHDPGDEDRRPIREYVEANAARVKRDEKRMHQALLKHQALIVTKRDGRRVLLIQSGEMSNPKEGAFRVTEYWDDGPRGHITRKSILRLAQDLASDVSPDIIAPASEADVMKWFGTKKFIEGSEHVFEMQRRNQRG